MKILLVAKKKTQALRARLIEEINKRGHQVVEMDYEGLSFSIGKEFQIQNQGKEVSDDFDAVILRMAPGGVMVYYKDLLARHFSKKSFVVNGNSYIKWPYFGKITQNYLLAQAGIPTVSTSVFATKALLKSGTSIDYPVVAKRHFGRLGNSVFQANDENQLMEIVKNDTANFLIQPLLPTREDYRVIVIAGKALPQAMKKHAPEGQLVTNISQGGHAQAVDTNEELRNLAQASAQLFEADYAGVDIMYDKDSHPHVLEINRSANFSGFEESTKINVAAEIIKMLEEKAND